MSRFGNFCHRMASNIKSIILPVQQISGGINNDTSMPATQLSMEAKARHDRICYLVIAVSLIVIIVYCYYQSMVSQKSQQQELANASINIEVASSALDADKMWRNHFEDKLMDSNKQTSEKLQLIETIVNQIELGDKECRNSFR